jgi:hypothetical protein
VETSGLWDLGKTPVRISTLDALLENYPITEDKIKLSQGFKNGFRLEYKGPRISITTKKLKSAVESIEPNNSLDQ